MQKILVLITAVTLLTACGDDPASPANEQVPQNEPARGILLTTPPHPPDSSLCLDAPTIPFTDLDLHQPLSMEEPAARSPYRDPDYGTCLVRVTDRNADLPEGYSTSGLKNEYSRVQSFNSDGNLILVRSVEGTWYLYAADSLAPLGQVPIDVEPRWSAQDPNIIYFFSDTRLMAYDLLRGVLGTQHDFAGETPGAVMVWTRYEGSPSANGLTWGMMVENDDWLADAFLVYDLSTDKVLARKDLRSWTQAEREIDSVTISPLGQFFLVQMDKICDRGTLGTEQAPCGLMVYDRQLENGRGLLRIVGHSDTALDASGREVFVFQDIDTDHLSMLDLASGTVTPLLPLDFSHTGFGLHISGRAFAFPGWVVISTHDNDPQAYKWMDDSIFALELTPGGRIVRLASSHSLVDENMEHDYWAEPQATSNLDLTRILFTSNWGRSGTGEVEMYMIELPQNWTSLLP